MRVENKISSLFIRLTAIIYLILYLIETLQGYQRFSILVEISYVSVVILLGIYGLFLLRTNRLLKFWENILVNSIGLLIVTMIIIRTNGIESSFFPYLYFIPLVYSAINRSRKFLVLSNILGIITVLIWIFITDYTFKYLFNSDFFVAIAIYVTIIYIIRTYHVECFSCMLEKESCFNQGSCLFYQIKWNDQLGDEKNDKSH